MTAPLPDSVRSSIEHGSLDLADRTNEAKATALRLSSALTDAVYDRDAFERRLREHLAALDADDAARAAAGLPALPRAVYWADPEPPKEDPAR